MHFQPMRSLYDSLIWSCLQAKAQGITNYLYHHGEKVTQHIWWLHVLDARQCSSILSPFTMTRPTNGIIWGSTEDGVL